MNNSEPIYLSDKNLAKRWDLSFRTLQRWRWKGVGPPYTKIGGRIRYHFDHVKEFEEANKVINSASSNSNLSIT